MDDATRLAFGMREVVSEKRGKSFKRRERKEKSLETLPGKI